MIFDLRIYQTRPGTMARQLKLYAAHGLQAQTKHLGKPYFYGVVETGDVNSYVHLWQYSNAADREARRETLYEDENWLNYRDLSSEAGYQIRQTNMLLKPASFWTPETK